MLLAFVSLVGAPYIVLMPIFAKEVLHGGAHTLGVLTGATGVGAIAGALWLASRRDSSNLERVITLAGTTFGLALVAFSLSGKLVLSLALLVAVGAGMMITMAAVNTRIQTLVEEDKRGRVMSFFTMAFFGMAPFGALAAGALAAKIGAPTTVTWGGIATLLAVVLFSIVRRE
jgi:predicted MFS family arabinose efflux permease